jgi:hypothetical protein
MMETNLITLVIGVAGGIAIGAAGAWWLNQQAKTLEARLYTALSKAATQIAHLQIDKRAEADAAASLAAVEAAKAQAKASVAAL